MTMYRMFTLTLICRMKFLRNKAVPFCSAHPALGAQTHSSAAAMPQLFIKPASIIWGYSPKHGGGLKQELTSHSENGLYCENRRTRIKDNIYLRRICKDPWLLAMHTADEELKRGLPIIERLKA